MKILARNDEDPSYWEPNVPDAIDCLRCHCGGRALVVVPRREGQVLGLVCSNYRCGQECRNNDPEAIALEWEQANLEALCEEHSWFLVEGGKPDVFRCSHCFAYWTLTRRRSHE